MSVHTCRNDGKLVDVDWFAQAGVINAHVEPGIVQLYPGYYEIKLPLGWSPVDGESRSENVVDDSVAVDVVDSGRGRVLVSPVHVRVRRAARKRHRGTDR